MTNNIKINIVELGLMSLIGFMWLSMETGGWAREDAYNFSVHKRRGISGVTEECFVSGKALLYEINYLGS